MTTAPPTLERAQALLSQTCGPSGDGDCEEHGRPDLRAPPERELIEVLPQLPTRDRQRLREDFVQAFETSHCSFGQRNLLHVLGAVRDDALVEAAGRRLNTRPSIVRARYLVYQAQLGRTDFLPTAWDLLTPEPSFYRLRALHTIALLDPAALPRALQRIEHDAPPRVFYTDDEDFCMSAVFRILTRAGLPVTHFSREGDARNALARCQSPDFDVFITDCRKPHHSGGELISALRRACPRYVPAMVLSFLGGDPLQAPGHEMDFVVGKPWENVVLKAVVRLLWPAPGDAARLAETDLNTAWAMLT
jgi:CheY-like chemotaxis protein